MSENQEPSLTNGICAIAKKLATVQKQAREMGIFVGDRELLTCGQWVRASPAEMSCGDYR